MLEQLVESLEADGTRLVFAEMKGAVQAKLRAGGGGGVALSDEERFPPTLNAALASYLAEHPDAVDRPEDAGGQRS
jgi:hypothetical protein